MGLRAVPRDAGRERIGVRAWMWVLGLSSRQQPTKVVQPGCFVLDTASITVHDVVTCHAGTVGRRCNHHHHRYRCTLELSACSYVLPSSKFIDNILAATTLHLFRLSTNSTRTPSTARGAQPSHLQARHPSDTTTICHPPARCRQPLTLNTTL